jgi:superfamily II DNA/RNA helicase
VTNSSFNVALRKCSSMRPGVPTIICAPLDVKAFRVQSIVLCPTRELADQVASELRRLARSIHNIKVLTLCGGAPFGPQIGIDS